MTDDGEYGHGGLGGIAAGPTPALAPRLYDAIEALAVLLALLATFRVLSGSAGRDADTMVLGLLLSAPAALVARPWRVLSPWVVLMTALLPVSAVLICYVDPLQFSFAKDLAVWGYGPMLFLISAGFGRDSQRRLLMLVTVCLLVVWAVVHGLQPWFEFQDPSRPLVGTFYWHNQMGTFCGVGALIGLTLVAFESWPARMLGGITALLGGVGLVLSTSRASLVFCALAFAFLVLLLLRRRHWLRSLLLLSIVAVSVAAALGARALAGDGGGATQAQIVGTTGSRPFETNVIARLHFWKAAIAIFLDHPLKGEGHGTFLLELPAHLPAGAGLSRWTHNGVLNAAADGGLLLGLPVAIATLLALVAAARVLFRAMTQDEEWGKVAAALAVAVLVAHALFDFDWIYPMLTGTLGITLGVVVAPSRSQASSTAQAQPRSRGWAPAAAIAATVGLCVFTGYAARVWQDQQSALQVARVAAKNGDYQRAVQDLEEARHRLVPNPQLYAAELDVAVRAVNSGRTLSVKQTQHAVRESASLARVDPSVAQVRARVLRFLP